MPSRRVFKDRILREARAQQTSVVLDLTLSLSALTAASPLAALDRIPILTSGGQARYVLGSTARNYVLGISGGTANIPENLTVVGTVTGAALAGPLTTAIQPNVTTMTALTTIGTLVAGAVPASLVTAGTFGAGAYTFPSTLNITTSALIGTTTAATGAPILDVLGSLGIVIGDVTTNATQKIGRIASRHYTNAEETVAMLVVVNDSTNNSLRIGGGSGTLNAANTVGIYTAANNTTLTGTLRASWDGTGLFAQVGNATIGGTLGVTGAVTGGTYNGQTISSAASFTGTVTVASTLNVANLIQFSGTTANIVADTADGSDTKQLNLGAGGAASNTRGGYILLYGNENATQNGRLLLGSGNAAASDFVAQIKGITFLSVTRPAAVNVMDFTGTLALAGGSTTNALSVTTTGAITSTFRYDSSNRLDIAVSSAGVVTYDAVGASASHSFSDAVTMASTLAVTGTISGSNLSGTNTGDQTITLTGDVTGSGTGTFAATIANDAVTYAKMQDTLAGNVVLTRAASGAGEIGETALGASELLGRGSTGNVAAITVGSGLTMTGTTLSATGGGSGDVVGPASATDNAVVRFDGTTGKLVQGNPSWLVDDDGTLRALQTTDDANGYSIVFELSDTSVVASQEFGRIDAKHNDASLGANTATRVLFYSKDSFGSGEISFQTWAIGDTNPVEKLHIGGTSTAAVVGVRNARFFHNNDGGDYDARFAGDTLPGLLFVDAGQDSVALFHTSATAANFQAGRGIAYIANATTVPTGDPTGGGFLYVEGGALKWRGSSGTITTIALA